MLLIGNVRANFSSATAHLLRKPALHQAEEGFGGIGLGIGLKAKKNNGLAEMSS